MTSLKEYMHQRSIDDGQGRIHSCPELMECIQAVGFLPLLESGIRGFSAEALVREECRYVAYDDGG